MPAHRAAGGAMLGFDERGEVFDLGNVVRRRIREDYRGTVAELHRRYREAHLESKGIVETALREDGDLDHRRLVTAYPFEWPATMFKDAVLFHLRLLGELDKAGLTLKDALPNNIVFDHTTPVFVDFLSLVPTGRLVEEGWLDARDYADARYAVIERMLLPYMILPLLHFARGDFRTARDLLSWRSCNCEGRPPPWSELLRPAGGRAFLATLGAAARLLLGRAGYRSAPAGDFNTLIEELIGFVERLDVAPRTSAYASYYSEKSEDLPAGETSAFLPKQKAVHDILRERAPASVLDIGANTGWYSALAARLGASVIALEEDESCADILYRRSKAQELRVLPLRAPFGELTREIPAATALAAARFGGHSTAGPLYRAGMERLGAELVLVLGLAHHLVLGEGRAIDDLFRVLQALCGRTLVLEFVSLDDDRIRAEPGFFPHLGDYDGASYNLEAFLQAGRRYFDAVEVRPSHPPTRSILIFDKRSP